MGIGGPKLGPCENKSKRVHEMKNLRICTYTVHQEVLVGENFGGR